MNEVLLRGAPSARGEGARRTGAFAAAERAAPLSALSAADTEAELSALPARLLALREGAKQGRDPTAADETLAVLLHIGKTLPARRVLEIGTGEGYTAAALALACPRAEIVTVEADAVRCAAARRLFAALGVAGRVTSLFADAAAALGAQQGAFDLIFLDGPKAQYVHWLPRLKALLSVGGVLAADDVLLYGWADGSAPVPYKRRSIAARLGEYLAAVQGDAELETLLLRCGEGLAITRKLCAAPA